MKNGSRKRKMVTGNWKAGVILFVRVNFLNVLWREGGIKLVENVVQTRIHDLVIVRQTVKLGRV